VLLLLLERLVVAVVAEYQVGAKNQLDEGHY
jgi:hypothetical protein